MSIVARVRFAILACAVSLAPAGTAAPAAVPGGGRTLPPAETAREFAAALLAETNRVRKIHGRTPLRTRPELDIAADDQAAFMALTLSAQHRSPVPGRETPWERVRRRGYEAGKVAENVASIPVGRADERHAVPQIAAQLVEQWMNSPGHRANLLSREYSFLGGSVRLARLPGDLWSAFGVQVFCAPAPRGSGI